MEKSELINYLDDLLYSSTGNHINSLQEAILTGVLNGQKYSEIAKQYKCSNGHVKDEAYKLWQLLSQSLGEEINKSNLRVRVEKINTKKSQNIENTYQIGIVNVCSKQFQEDEKNEDVIEDEKILIESIRKQLKRETIPRLLQLGLTPEQIAEVLDLPIQEVKKIIAVI